VRSVHRIPAFVSSTLYVAHPHYESEQLSLSASCISALVPSLSMQIDSVTDVTEKFARLCADETKQVLACCPAHYSSTIIPWIVSPHIESVPSIPPLGYVKVQTYHASRSSVDIPIDSNTVICTSTALPNVGSSWIINPQYISFYSSGSSLSVYLLKLGVGHAMLLSSS